MTTGKTVASTRRTLVGKVMSLLLSMLSRLIIAFLPRSKHLLISWLQSPSAVILEPQKIKSDTVSPSISHEVMGLDAMIFIFWMLSFKPTFSLSSFTFIKRLLSLSFTFLSVDSGPPGSSQWFSSKVSACNARAAGDLGLIPGLGNSPGGGHGYPFQYSCLENPMDRGTWQGIPWGSKSQTRLKWLSMHTVYICQSQSPSSSHLPLPLGIYTLVFLLLLSK